MLCSKKKISIISTSKGYTIDTQARFPTTMYRPIARGLMHFSFVKLMSGTPSSCSTPAVGKLAEIYR